MKNQFQNYNFRFGSKGKISKQTFKNIRISLLASTLILEKSLTVNYQSAIDLKKFMKSLFEIAKNYEDRRSKKILSSYLRNHNAIDALCQIAQNNKQLNFAENYVQIRHNPLKSTKPTNTDMSYVELKDSTTCRENSSGKVKKFVFAGIEEDGSNFDKCLLDNNLFGFQPVIELSPFPSRTTKLEEIEKMNSKNNIKKTSQFKGDVQNKKFQYKIDISSEQQNKLFCGEENEFNIKLQLKERPERKQLNSFYAFLYANKLDISQYNQTCKFEFDNNLEANCKFIVKPNEIGQTDLFFDIVQNANIFERIPLQFQIINP